MNWPRRSDLNKLVDVLAFASFASLTTTGIILKYILVAGSGHRYTIWQLDRHEWGDLHFWISVGFFSVLTLHLFLHWKWIFVALKGKSAEYSGRRLGLGFVGLATLILLAISPILSPVEQTSAGEKSKSGELGNKEGTILREGPEQEPQKRESTQTGNYPQPKFEDGDSPVVFGYMTLDEVATQNNIPVAKVIELLGVDPGTSPNAKLGQLRKDYGFTMEEIRERIARFHSENE